MNFDKDVFAARLRAKRAEADISQEELAKKAGMSAKTIIGYENAQGIVPGADKIVALSSALGCDPNYLIGWQCPPQGKLVPVDFGAPELLRS